MSELYESLRQDEHLTFGGGEYLTPLLHQEPGLFEPNSPLSPREEALLLGYADGCPVAHRLTDPFNPDPGRDPESMRNRYGEVNFWFRHIVHSSEYLNPELAEQLQQPVGRREPSGDNFEQESVPPSFYSELSPMGTLWGYALPRILIKQLGSDRLPQYESQRRLDKALTVLDGALSEARSPEDLLALVAEGVSRDIGPGEGGDVGAEDVLHEALSLGWFKEHHAADMVGMVKEALRWKAPNLWTYYSEQLTDDEKLENGIIVDNPTLRTGAGSVSIEGLPAFHDNNFGYTLWEGVTDPANPEGVRGIVMHVPAASMSKVWELREKGYWESVEVLRGSGSLVYSEDGGDSWITAPLDADHPTANDTEVMRGDLYSVVADEQGIVVLSRPSKEFAISFERSVTQAPEDELSRRILAQVALRRSDRS